MKQRLVIFRRKLDNENSTEKPRQERSTQHVSGVDTEQTVVQNRRVGRQRRGGDERAFRRRMLVRIMNGVGKTHDTFNDPGLEHCPRALGTALYFLSVTQDLLSVGGLLVTSFCLLAHEMPLVPGTPTREVCLAKRRKSKRDAR